MSQFPYSYGFYDSCENQYNPYNFTPNTYGYFNNNYCTNNLDFTPPTFQNFQDNPVCTPPNFQNDDQPSSLEISIQSLIEARQNDDQPLSLEISVQALLEESQRFNESSQRLIELMCNNSSQVFKIIKI